ncbi:MAG: DEAD/DEAH box helicase [Verrucomicrobia bacterium]|nr:DEAD/DEAH box helicase [Verrucomicrobiota bacterium]
MSARASQPELFGPPPEPAPGQFDLRVTLDYQDPHIRLEWSEHSSRVATATVRYDTAARLLRWELERFDAGTLAADSTSTHRASIRAHLKRFRELFPVRADGFHAGAIELAPEHPPTAPATWVPLQLPSALPCWLWLEGQIVRMARDLAATARLPTPPILEALASNPLLQREARRLQRQRQAQAQRAERIRLATLRQQAEKHRREHARRSATHHPPAATPATAPSPVTRPLPPVPVTIDPPHLELQETLLPLTDLRSYFLAERAARWWVSNQTDDLLALPHCRIQRLDYQIRTALRVLGPLRGRALLSDEVGLGKTIEAGLVLKEYLTRGMIKRFLVLTVPSLIDQWEEELREKFGLETATTNHPAFRANPDTFWREHPAVIASIHTLKQPAHTAIAQTVNWDLLIVDEAHYLRNRTSQAWQSVNGLPRQFLLLLTATPVQNSLEELYNLVTLLKPGQLPSPKEFRARFIDSRRPHQPREPEQLRQLLGQVMVRNTRANAGVTLPPRRAETVLFHPPDPERHHRERWETEFREALARLTPGQASLWGRLLLQAAGSSPSAWREMLESFPDRAAAARWTTDGDHAGTWTRKTDLLLPLARLPHGVVVFTQFLRTQSALEAVLRAAGAPTWVLNGQTPAAQRQSIADHFREQGGALLLTHSGTEGRNLQFCQRLVNFDLPWNPMEIEQRIGRLHRLGQQHPVHIYNFVQAGTLQEHLLEVLQEKLNLFELVVGETGLILGDRFSSDEFAEEILRRWRESQGRVAESFQALGDELAAANARYQQVKQLDATIFAGDYELL